MPTSCRSDASDSSRCSSGSTSSRRPIASAKRATSAECPCSRGSLRVDRLREHVEGATIGLAQLGVQALGLQDRPELLPERDEDGVVVLGEPAAPAGGDEDAVEAVTLRDRDDHGVAELALLADHGPRGDGLGGEALRLCLSGRRLHALGGDDVEMAAHVPAPPGDELALGGTGQLERRTEKDLAHAIDVSLTALRAVHAVHAVAQRRRASGARRCAGAPAASARASCGSGRCGSGPSRTSARSRARETSRTSRSACAWRVRSSSSARTAASARPRARRQPTSATATSASAPKIRIAESRSRTSTETPATRQITTYAAMTAAAEPRRSSPHGWAGAETPGCMGRRH